VPDSPHAARVSSSALLGFVDRAELERALEPFVPDAGDREFLVRCVVAEGPAHHRGANYVLLRLLARALEAAHARPGPPRDGLPVPMHVPPHLRRADGEQCYPLKLPTGPLERLAQGAPREVEAMADCLTDGPAQHSVANVLMVSMLAALLEALEQK
jgi:hypothetical protein